VSIGNNAAEIVEFRDVDLGAGVGHAVERQRLRQTAEHGAVLRRHLVHELGGDKTAGARHVLRHDDRVARNVPGQELGDQAAVQVIAAARAIADQHAQRLAAVEIGNRVGVCGRCRANQDNGGRQSVSSVSHARALSCKSWFHQSLIHASAKASRAMRPMIAVLIRHAIAGRRSSPRAPSKAGVINPRNAAITPVVSASTHRSRP
jgi:hypothetical protein